MKKKLTALLLAALLLLAVASCASEGAPEGTAANETSDDAPTAVDVETEPPVDPYDPHLPDRDFEGYVFQFSGRGAAGSKEAWDTHDIVVEEQTGEVLDDAVYSRNAYVSEKYNVEFKLAYLGDTSTSNSSSGLFKAVSQSVMAGDAAYDAVIAPPYDTTGFAKNGYSLDLAGLEHINLTRPWWDQQAISDLTLNGKIYFTTGELTYVDNKSTQCMLFIKHLIDDYNLENPYELVDNGEWTLDKLISMSDAVTQDLNGDGAISDDDRVGYIYWQDGCFGLTHAAGNRFGGVDESGELQLTFYTDRMTSFWDKIITFASGDSAWSIKNDPVINKGKTADEIISYMVDGSHTLFSFGYINHVLYLRQSETDFGVIPNPKFDEAQEQYYSTAHGWGTPFVSVMIDNADPARTAFILEAMAAKSMELVTPAFYDMTLTGKSVRDVESEGMLDIIFGGKVYDMGYYFVWGGLTDKLMTAWNSLDPNLTSLYEKVEEKALADLETTRELFAAIQ